MSRQDTYENLCRKCFIKINKPTKKEVSKIVMTKYKEECDCCRRKEPVVDYVEDCYD